MYMCLTICVSFLKIMYFIFYPTVGFIFLLICKSSLWIKDGCPLPAIWILEYLISGVRFQGMAWVFNFIFLDDHLSGHPLHIACSVICLYFFRCLFRL